MCADGVVTFTKGISNIFFRGRSGRRRGIGLSRKFQVTATSNNEHVLMTGASQRNQERTVNLPILNQTEHGEVLPVSCQRKL